MKFLKNKLSLTAMTLAVIFSGLFLAACSANAVTRDNHYGLVNANQLIVATSADFPPFQSIVNRQYVGIDIDIAQTIADEMGLQLVIRNMQFAATIPALTSTNRAVASDLVLSGMTITAERAQVVDFSTGYFDSGQIIMTNASRGTLNNDMTADQIRAHLSTQTIGAVAGQTGYNHAREIAGNNVMVFSNNHLLALAMQNGQVHYSIQGAVATQGIVNANPGLVAINVPLTDEQYGAAVARGNTNLLNRVNEIIKAMQADGRMTAIFNKHLATV